MQSLIKGLMVSLSLVRLRRVGRFAPRQVGDEHRESSAANKPKAETMIVNVSNGVERGSYTSPRPTGTTAD